MIPFLAVSERPPPPPPDLPALVGIRAVDEEDEVRVRVEPETVSTDVTTTTEIEVDVEEVSSDVVSSALLEVTA